jgi:cytochrome c-type biogenesis protein CcmH/NrfG
MDEDALLARAAKERGSGDLRAAMLDLKNVLRKNPANGAARLALGEVALQSGDVDAAILELEVARKGGVNAERAMVPRVPGAPAPGGRTEAPR